jgi:CMP-N,N'-diacetyllegionaminic acid synthase
MNKIIAMIPARLGSQRVPKKNLRLLAGKPMISYVIETALLSGVFDEVYVNTEADIIGEVAIKYGAKFYKRSEEFATNTSGNDDFAYDFIKNTDGDILIQILPTSPLLTTDEIKLFVDEMINKDYDTMISVIDHKIACIYDGKPINFKLLEPHISSQLMMPVQSYATVLMGWKYESFKQSMEKFGFAYHGSDSKIGYFSLKGLSEIDIDEEKDFQLAVVALQYKKNTKTFKTEFYGEAT